MPILDTSIFRERAVILSAMLSTLTDAIPTVYVGEDGIIRILFEIEAGQLENAYMAAQLLLEDIFPQTASAPALRLHGDTYNIPFLTGLYATGDLKFSGPGGTVIPSGTQAGADPGSGLDLITFVTTENVQIPNPGIPVAPTVAVNATAGALDGTYEYLITFLTAEGETVAGAQSDAVVPADEQVDISDIPLGGSGTTGRRIYRQKDGAGDFLLVATINDNTTTTHTDNLDDITAGPGIPPEVDTANAVSAHAVATQAGTDGNVAAGTIITIVSGPSGLTDVTNIAGFSGGTNQEEIEHYRKRLMTYLRNPRTGSEVDLKFWAEQIEGVETATVFSNDNLGTPTFGHTTIRIAGPGGIIPASDVIDAVQAYLEGKDVANITIHVGTFDELPTTVDVEVTLDSGFILDDVENDVIEAVVNYMATIPIGGTAYAAGIIDAVFGLAGIVNITTTFTDTTAGDTEKFIVGDADVTVTEAP